MVGSGRYRDLGVSHPYNCRPPDTTQPQSASLWSCSCQLHLCHLLDSSHGIRDQLDALGRYFVELPLDPILLEYGSMYRTHHKLSASITSFLPFLPIHHTQAIRQIRSTTRRRESFLSAFQLLGPLGSREVIC